MMATYPKRESFFAHKFTRLLAKCCVANEIGALGAWMLTVIVQTEDASHYRRGVTFYDGQLMPLMGITSKKTMVAVRRRAIEAGWLHFDAGHKGKASTYWVMIPSHAQGLDDSPSDEGHDDYEETIRCKNGTAKGAYREPKGERKGRTSGTERGAIHPVPVPVPVPTPADGVCQRLSDFPQTIQTDAVSLYHAYSRRRWGGDADLTTEQAGRDLRELASRLQFYLSAKGQLMSYFANPPPGRMTTEKLWHIFKYLGLEPRPEDKVPPRPSQQFKDFTAERLAKQMAIS